MNKKSKTPSTPRDSEQLLIEQIEQFKGKNFFCTTIGRAQLACELSRTKSDASVTCFFLDLYQSKQAGKIVEEQGLEVEILCQPDFPDEEYDCIAMPFLKNGINELTRDFLQAGYERLKLKGKMATSTDHPQDQWLHEEMKKLFPKVTRIPSKKGVAYLGIKHAPLKKIKNYDAEFDFKDQENIIKVITRPGVFSHRQLDAGARALIKVMQIQENDQILELGCGSGAVSFAAVLRAEGVCVHAVDSNPRAIECTEKGAELNGLSTITTELTDEGPQNRKPQFDLVLANPPYFSQNQIDQIFLDSGYESLKTKGRMQIVTRKPQWFEEQMNSRFTNIETVKSGHYFIVSAKKR